MESIHLKRGLQVMNFCAVILTIIINGLAVILPINNKTTQELSDNIPNLFVPAGLTFSIWSVIYILLIMFTVYQMRDVFSKKPVDMPFLQKISFWFILASLGNILWILLWHYEYVTVSLLAMILLLVSLVMIYIRLGIGKTHVSRLEQWCVHIPFSVYLGWITVATIANVTAVLVVTGWNRFGLSQDLWAILIIIIALVLTLVVLFTKKDAAYSFVIVWALLGIVIKRLGNDPIYGVQTTIAAVALGALLIIFISAIATILLSFIHKPKKA